MRSLLWWTLPLALVACKPSGSGAPDAGPMPVPVASAAPSGSATSPAPSTAAQPPATHEGGALVRSAAGDRLYLADEDHRTVRVFALPLSPDAAPIDVAMPGPPAEVLPLGDRVLVTVRDPGLLLVLRVDAKDGLVETARIPLPADAWGVGVSPDLSTAIVTSAWTAKAAVVDLVSARVRTTLDVPREPRAVVFRDDRSAYLTHLTSASLTRIDDVSGAATAKPVVLPAAPLRAPLGTALAASLAYSAVLSPARDRLFVPRHALGALGHNAWFGAATVDVLLLDGEKPLSPIHYPNAPAHKSALASQVLSGGDTDLPGGSLTPFTQPRAAIYRKATRTLLVAGEGDDLVAELDALAVDPTLSVLRTYKVGSKPDTASGTSTVCGAPTGLALSVDEATAWVFCRSTYELATVKLDPHDGRKTDLPPPEVRKVASDPLGPEVVAGRRIFYSALDPLTSGGVACNGCHPEGRDDGYTWHEATFTTADGENANFVGVADNVPKEARRKGYPRRTPMIAGRVGGAGPFGWHAENPDIVARLKAGFGLHRWGGIPKHDEANLAARALFLAPFVRKLTPPPAHAEPLTPVEERGKKLFVSPETQCSRCHAPDTDYTDRVAYPLRKLPPPAGYDDDPKADFKTPSLRFLAGRAPYFHDGSAATLEQLVEKNGDRMGKTNHLSADDRVALVAYLRTL